MRPYKSLIHLLLAVAALALAGNAQASSVIDGIAVGSAGSNTQVGLTGSGPSLTSASSIKYYIPLHEDYIGVYGVGSSPCSNGAGTCADTGSGYGYDDADALYMNLFFDLSGHAPSQSAELAFQFDDLDLIDVNDPAGFFESISLSYWNWDTNTSAFATDPVLVAGTIKTAGTSPDPTIDPVDENLITWDLSLAALDALNASAQAQNGFWIRLGFGSQYNNTGTNTPEYLAAQLTVSPVPVPAAFWLFGSALIGFVGISRRRKIS